MLPKLHQPKPFFYFVAEKLSNSLSLLTTTQNDKRNYFDKSFTNNIHMFIEIIIGVVSAVVNQLPLVYPNLH